MHNRSKTVTLPQVLSGLILIDVYRKDQVSIVLLIVTDKARGLRIYKIDRHGFIINNTKRIDQEFRVEADHDILTLFFNIDLFIHGTQEDTEATDVTAAILADVPQEDKQTLYKETMKYLAGLYGENTDSSEESAAE